MNNIKLLVIITDEGYDKRINLFLNQFGIKYKTVSKASGTASPSILDYFGLVETKKNIFLAIISEKQTNKIFIGLKNFFKLDKKGKGIAFILPISSSNKFLSDNFNKYRIERNKLTMKEKNEYNYHLIITIVSEGNLEKVMSIAKKIGGSGGTVIKGRELSSSIPKEILGFNIGSEKEIILNIVTEKDRKKVMKEITDAVGIKTEAEGICFSIPVENTLGLEIYK